MVRGHPHSGNVVYFVRAEGTGLIKIGKAVCVYKRLAGLKTQSPVKLTLLGVIQVGPDSIVEQMMHGRFRHLRHHGEWFLEGADLLEFIEAETTEPPKKPRQPPQQRKAQNAKRREYYRKRFPPIAGSSARP